MKFDLKALGTFVLGALLLGFKAQMPAEVQPAVDYIAMSVFGVNVFTGPAVSKK